MDYHHLAPICRFGVDDQRETSFKKEVKRMKLKFVTLSLLIVFGIVACSAGDSTSGEARDQPFTLLVYNVENLFDLDGISVFEEYGQDATRNPYPYSGARLLTKINNHASIIQQCNEGKGADIVAIQEFEIDFSQDPKFSLEAALEKYASRSVSELLGSDAVSAELTHFPVEFFLIKRLEELGLDGYHFYEPEFDVSWQERNIAHRCVFLSRFPAISIQQHPLKDARDVVEVTFDVHGHAFTVFNNHWKSGASSTRSEPTRVQNAGVVRKVLDARLSKDPNADIVLVGDFNSHHNAALRMGGPVEITGLNGVLGSQSVEQALFDGSADLYNLWYELPQPERGSEVWSGEWGTLMQMIVTPGLYDQHGVQYVDGSFHRLAMVGQNINESDGTPNAWVNLGKGAGYSDHLPVYASFRYENEADGTSLIAYDAEALGNEVETSHKSIPVDYSLSNREVHPDPERLAGLSEEAKLGCIGELYWVDAVKKGRGIDLEGVEYSLFASDYEARNWVNGIENGSSLIFAGEFGIYRGTLQFLIRDISWVDPKNEF